MNYKLIEPNECSNEIGFIEAFVRFGFSIFGDSFGKIDIKISEQCSCDNKRNKEIIVTPCSVNGIDTYCLGWRNVLSGWIRTFAGRYLTAIKSYKPRNAFTNRCTNTRCTKLKERQQKISSDRGERAFQNDDGSKTHI